MNVPNLFSSSDYTTLWNDLTWALSQAAPFVMLVIASYVVYIIIRQVMRVVRNDTDDDIYHSHREE